MTHSVDEREQLKAKAWECLLSYLGANEGSHSMPNLEAEQAQYVEIRTSTAAIPY
jgi:hypothetical protein